MNTLVIHPKDFSTRFLNRVYADVDATVVTGNVTRPNLIKMIDRHDQIMMLGHGTPLGLMSVGQFDEPDVIDDTFADQLGERDNNVFIWCNADQYVKWNDLKGFYTGMFVSEVGEARIMGLPPVSWKDVDESNKSFVGTIGRFATRGPRLMHAAAKHEYGSLAQRNPVAEYNHERLYYN